MEHPVFTIAATEHLVKECRCGPFRNGRYYPCTTYFALCGAVGEDKPSGLIRRRPARCKKCLLIAAWIKTVEDIRRDYRPARRATEQWDFEDRNPIDQNFDYRKVEQHTLNLLAQSRAAGFDALLIEAAAKIAGLEMIDDEILIPDEAAFRRFRMQLKNLTFGQRYAMGGTFHVPEIHPGSYATGCSVGFKPYKEGPSAWADPTAAVLHDRGCTLYPVRPLNEVMTEAPPIARPIPNDRPWFQDVVVPKPPTRHMALQKKATGDSNFRFQIPIDGEPDGALWDPSRGKSIPGPKGFEKYNLTLKIPYQSVMIPRQLIDQAIRLVDELEKSHKKFPAESRHSTRMNLRRVLSQLNLAKAMMPKAPAKK